jgi:phosphopantetheine--protein transferase-like protein
MVFADDYPPPPNREGFSLKNERNSRWAADALYSERMFHGPCWRGVSSVDRWGEDGSIGTLEVLPKDGFFRQPRAVTFLTDPVVLDAAGQIVGFWTMEHLTDGFLVFPYRFKALHIYSTQPAMYQKVRCLARIKLVGTQQVFSDIDMIGEDGRHWMRLEAWEDKRFCLPTAAYAFLLSPIKVTPSVPQDASFSSFLDSDSFSFLRLEKLFVGDEEFWRKVFAHIILSYNERKTFRNLGTSEITRTHWLLGRLVAKDAVRTYLKQRYGTEVGPADVEIRQDEYGRPIPDGTWVRQIDDIPCLSLAHTEGMTIAVAGPSNGNRSVGVDVERIRALGDGFEATAFTTAERALLQPMNASDRQEWTIRFWSAKEAVAKALGRGLLDRLSKLVVQDLDSSTGELKIYLQGGLAQEFPDLAHTPIRVCTTREDQYIVASTLI